MAKGEKLRFDSLGCRFLVERKKDVYRGSYKDFGRGRQPITPRQNQSPYIKGIISSQLHLSEYKTLALALRQFLICAAAYPG